MANWSDLKAAVAQVIKTNGNNEITGQILQDTLNSIISNVGANATYAGIARPTTNPGAPDGNVFYFATRAGTYTNFGSVELNEGLNILRWNGTSWLVTNVMNIVQEFGDSETAVISQKAVTEKLNTINDKINNQISEVEAAKDAALSEIEDTEQEAITNFNAQRVTPEMLSEGVKQLINAAGGGTINNLPDEEDITSTGSDTPVLKFKDKAYNPANFSGLGRVYLRKNIVDEKNVLTQSMIGKENTIYIIQYDYNLDNQLITVPSGCSFYFNGGTFINGNIVSNGTKFINAPNMLDNNLCIHGKIYNEYDAEISAYRFEEIIRKTKIFGQIMPWMNIAENNKQFIRCGISDFYLVLHINYDNVSNFNIVDSMFTSIENLCSDLTKYNIYVPYLKLHIDEGKSFSLAPYNTDEYRRNYVDYIKELLSEFNENGYRFEKIWVVNEHAPITVISYDTHSEWTSYLLELKEYISDTYNAETWASIAGVAMTNSCINTINISINYYPKISAFPLERSYGMDMSEKIINNINAYIAQTPNQSHIISETGTTGRLNNLAYPSDYSTDYEKDKRVYQCYWNNMVKAINLCSIDSVCSYFNIDNAEYQDAVYNILKGIRK